MREGFLELGGGRIWYSAYGEDLSISMTSLAAAGAAGPCVGVPHGIFLGHRPRLLLRASKGTGRDRGLDSLRHVCRLSPWPDCVQTAFSRLNPEVYNSMWGRSEFTISGTLRDLDLVPSLPRLSVPVLLICGDNDEADPRTVNEYQLAFPRADMAVIPNASHLHHLERPELFKAIVGEFLDRN